MKSATSEPSRITATAQTTPSAKIDLRAGPHRLADPLDVGGELAAMARHPDVVPGQHHDGDEEDRGVEDFLADPRQGLADRARKGGHERRADHAGQDARRDREPAAGEPFRHRQHDADDQARPR